MIEGMTNKEKYYSIIKKMENLVEEKKKSILIAEDAIDDENLKYVDGVRDSLAKAIKENEIAINVLYEILDYANSFKEE